MDTSRRKKWLYRASGATVMVAALAVGGAAVAGATVTSSPSSSGQAGGQQPDGGGHGPPPPLGTVSAVTSTTLTITDPRGTSHTVDLTGSTKYTKDGKSASATDVTSGEYVLIQPVRPSTAPVKGQRPSGPMVASAVHVVASLPTPPQRPGQVVPPGSSGYPQGPPAKGAPTGPNG